MASEFASLEFDLKPWDRALNTIFNRWKSIQQRDKQFSAIVGATVYADVMDHFKNEQGSKGKWPDWSSSYSAAIAGRVAFRTIRGRVVALDEYTIHEWGIKPPRKPGKKLQDSGKLRQSFTPNKWRKSNDGLMFYNNAKVKSGFPYAAAHDIGGPKLPQRQFMWLSVQGMRKMVTSIERWLAWGDSE